MALLQACLLQTIPVQVSAQTPASTAHLLEQRVKAASVFKFLGYVELPPAAFPAAESPLTIAVAGSGDMVRELTSVAMGRTSQGRTIKVQKAADPNAILESQVLFISREEHGRLREWIQATHGKPILIITENSGALEAGSMINFLVKDDRVRFEISLAASNQAQIRFDSRMLEIAVRVIRGERQ